MRITAIKQQKRRPDRVSVYVDGQFHGGAPLEFVERLGLRVGAETDPEQLAALEAGDVAARAYDAALRLLAARGRARAELADRLRRKGYEDELVDRTLARLTEQGYLDDVAFAEAWVRDRVRLKPKGRRALESELRRKGVSDRDAHAAIDAVLVDEEVDEHALARTAAEGWARRNLRGAPLSDRERMLVLRRKLYGFLARRGFGGEAARAAADEVLG